MHYLRTRRLVLALAAIMLAAAVFFAWLRNMSNEDFGLHLQERETKAEGIKS
jgi:hypothetical protein